MANLEVALDLGSQYISVASNKTGFIIKEPSVVAVDATDTKSVKAVGLTAVKMYSSPLSKVKLQRPIVEGTIVDKDNAKVLLKALIGKVLPRNSMFSRTTVLCVVPCALTKNEKQKIEFVLNMLDIKQTRFVVAPQASSVEIFKEFNINKGIICDMGADKTDIAAVVSGNILSGVTLYHSGRDMDKAIANYIQSKYNVQISPEEAEKIKCNCASLYPNDVSSIDVEGINVQKGIIERINITARELYDVVGGIINKYCQVIDSLLTSLSVEILGSIKAEGVFLCGGLSKLTGIDKYFYDYLKMNVRIPSNSDNVNINGALKLL